MPHSILLIQTSSRPESRTFTDYESVDECIEGVIKMYEDHLKRQHPTMTSITYDANQLFEFLDSLADLSCLIYQRATGTYAPCNKTWIKERIYLLLKKDISSRR